MTAGTSDTIGLRHLPILDGKMARQLAGVLQAMGTDRFAPELLLVMDRFVFFDSALILRYHQRRRPEVVYDAMSNSFRRNTSHNYLSGAYLLDPFYMRARQLAAPAFLRLADIAPEDFERSAYVTGYYKRSDIIDEVNFLVPVGPRATLAISLERSAAHQRFADEEIARLRDLTPLVAVLLGLDARLRGASAGAARDDAEHDRLEDALGALGAEVLTAREQEVIQKILKGYATGQIAHALDMSIETVRVHRRNAYAKLGISSLAELFALAMERMRR